MRFTTELLAVALALADVTSAQNSTYNATAAAQAKLTAELANLEKFWSYGRSPPVYPTPQGAGRDEWATAYEKAKTLVASMTDYEKNNITYGYTSKTNGCGGNSGSVPRVGFPGLCLSDAGNGLRGTDGVTGFASGVHVGATWNRNLAYQRAHYMGAEFKAKGVNVLLGPVVGPLGRVAEGGRNWEGFSNDPYLAGSLTFETVRGMQNNVVSCIKHLIGNEQELDRNPAGVNASMSANIDDKTMHEMYMWPFQDAVHAGVGSAMCSYQRANNSYGCQNSKVMNGLFKGELGFEGFIVSDWGAQHSGVASADAGLDMAMPSSAYWMNGNLSQAVTNGSLASTRLDDMATRIVASWYHLAEWQNPGHGMPVNLTLPHEYVNARDPASKPSTFQTAVEGHVLVKNVNNALPLKAPGFISLFGYDGIAPSSYTPDNSPAFTLSNFGFSPVSGVNSSELLMLFVSPSSIPSENLPGIAMNGTMVTGGGSGAAQPAYISDPFSAITEQAMQDDTWLQWDFHSQNPVVQRGSEACLVFINAFATESYDRPYLEDEYSDDIVLNVAAQCNNTMVILHNAGIRTIDAWYSNPNVTAIVYAHLPGQDSGKALVEVLYGKQSPSGRMPYTVAKKPADYGNLLHHLTPDNTSNYYTQDNFTEGVYIDYKAFIAQNITPRFEFGYGLTYTTFNYSSLQSKVLSNVSTAEYPPSSPIAQGGVASLWDVIATVDCTITNTGSVTASEVAQLYINIPGGPAKVLRGFNKQGVQRGKSVNFHFDLTRRDLSEWDVVSQQWRLQFGNYPIYVGKSVLDIQLTGSLSI
ncbi:putative glycosyl hydrolase [Aureobasidium pullulans]|uniref:beta-glucosidase n=1 Tax=Aureobasidium pullulans TaxID=5580 RepID=A0A4S9ZS00_AURPU|nr:putative glycosyl hydrolase [Aureobasidium pullulans]THY38964.1 putative glycosyl hydrolase [Aureobasidium pullulans]THZ13157.1 putative glycosyl hydrolase [Aureobasidium pullulans]TIA10360.1 putative glycosyl hydrolase [Aureobasidium pullulans]